MRLEKREAQDDFFPCCRGDDRWHVGPYMIWKIVLVGMLSLLIAGTAIFVLALVLWAPAALLFIIGIPALIFGAGYGVLTLRHGFEIRRKTNED